MKRLIFAVVFFSFCSLSIADDSTKHRVGLNLGLHIPTGNYQEDGFPKFKYKTGTFMGIDYAYNINDKFSMGAFIEKYSFDSESQKFAYADYNSNYTMELQITDITSVVIGMLMQYRTQVNQFLMYGTLKLGINSSDADISANLNGTYQGQTITAGASDSTDDTSIALILEVGALYPINDQFDFNFGAKYSYLPVSYEGENTNLGGTTLVIGAGYRF